MIDNVERAKSRLENIKTIEPLLAALRTISMGTWQAASNRLSDIKNYEESFIDILDEIIPVLGSKQKPTLQKEGYTIILIIGTERGLCGKFNQNLLEKVFSWIETQKLTSYQIWAMGQRMIDALDKQNVDISWRYSLPTGRLFEYHDAFLLSQIWLKDYESFSFDKLIIMFNQLSKGNPYKFQTKTLLPFEIYPAHQLNNGREKIWPPSIFETSPKCIFRKIIQHFITTSLYRAVLESTAAEHSSRYNMMEEAKDNADNIMSELNQIINTERKKKITKEMQELATGAGLLDKK